MHIWESLKKYTWLIILLGIIISFILPAIGLILQPYLSYLLMVLMFLSYLNVDIKEIFAHLQSFKEEIWALLIIHLSSPLLVLLLKPFLSSEIFLGLIIATTISSGMSVVFLSQLYGGVPSQALIITTISNMFSPITVPFIVLLFTKATIEINVFSMSMTMLKLVVVPFVIATLIRRSWFKAPLNKGATGMSIVVLFLLILGVVAPLRDIILNNVKQAIFLSFLISGLVIINFFLGYLLGKNQQERITFGISTSYKNFTLATVTALALFSPLVALPAILYTIINNLFLIPLQLIFVRRNR